jgi:hypothetical protein
MIIIHYRIDREKNSSAFSDSVSIIIKYVRPDIMKNILNVKNGKFYSSINTIH